MKKLGEILDMDGEISKILYKCDSHDSYIMHEVNADGSFINTVSLNENELSKLHEAMRKIKNY